MQFEIEFVEGEVFDVCVTISGALTVEGSRAWLAAAVGDLRWRPGMKVLVDGTGLEAGAFVGADLRSVAETTVTENAAWGAAYSAMVVEDPAVYGLVRMWQVATREMDWQTDIFHTRDDALAWLAEQPSHTPSW